MRAPEGAAVPRVSVGLAVYNGEHYLDEAIESILAQTYRDFELVICDNDSHDTTADICAAFAASDERVRYYRNPYNVGGVRNENRTQFLARGELFKLAAHDDVISNNFLAECVAALDADRSIDLAVPSVVVIDADGAVLPIDAVVAGVEATAPRRIRAMTAPGYMCEATYGLARMSALRAVRPQDNFLHSDRIQLCELGLRGPFRHAADAVLYRRLHLGNVLVDSRARMSWFQPELRRSGKVRLPHWQLLVGYAGMIARSELPRSEQTRCALEVGRWAVAARRSLVMDVLYAVRMLAIGRAGRRRRYRGADQAGQQAGDGDQAVSTSVVVLGPPAGTTSVPDALWAFLDTLDHTRVYPTVIDAGSGVDVGSPLFDELRRGGVPVMVTDSRRSGTAVLPNIVLELALFLRLADASTIHVLSDDVRLFRLVRLARRLLPDVFEVTESPYAPAAAFAGRPT